MKEKKMIWTVLDRLRPIIIEKLLNPEVLDSCKRGSVFFYDGIDSEDVSCTSDIAQLIIPLNDEEAEILSADEYFTAQESKYHNVWYAYPDSGIPLPWNEWQGNVIITLKTDCRQNYMLCISLVCYGSKNVVVGHGKVITRGSFAEIAQTVKLDRFPRIASAYFNTCLEAVVAKIEESELHDREESLFADTDITDYGSVMKFVDFLKDKNALKSKGHGMELFAYGNVVCLIDKSSQRVNVLVDREGKAQFCRLDDFPAELVGMIRREKSDWNLGVHSLSIGKFNKSGQALVTWVISPYYYCPMDEDGFGEEEEYEVAVTCHINTDGQLVDTPVWKPYSGPRR